ncbi:MAG: radical SAM protein [Theionarchaea archaeon]|nr:radical SAM protein [Theionarchaea archaeon]
MMKNKYPLLGEDIFYARIQTDSGERIKICNTTTEKEFGSNPATVSLLDLCNGVHSVSEIMGSLSKHSGEPLLEVAKDVCEILKIAQEKGIITLESTPVHECSRMKIIELKYPLESAEIEITNRCNLHCLHCVNDSGNPYPHELTTAEILSTIDRLSSMGVYRLLISGGEPLCHPDLFTIIGHARKAPMIVDIFTNATLITEEHVEQFRKLNVRRFSVSIDSVEENVHDKFRSKKGALRRTLDAINLLKEAGFPIWPYVSVNQLNKDSIIDILRFFKDNGLTNFQLTPVRFSGRGVQGLAISPEEYYQITVIQLTYLKKEFPEAFQRLGQKKESTCGLARTTICIHADGTILPCPGCIKEMGVGNVRDVDLGRLWEDGKTLESLRKMSTESERLCKGCKYLATCVGCIASSFILEKKVTCYDPYICAYRRAKDAVLTDVEHAAL